MNASTVRFAASKDTVLVWRDGVALASMCWQFALELGRAYQDVGEKGTRGQCIERSASFDGEHRVVRAHVTERDEIRVLVLSNGIVVGDWKPRVALELGNAMIGVARRAEEHAKHERVIADQALMMRLGGQLSLSGNRDINDEAWKEAETDSQLRKTIPTPSSIRSKEKFGYPQVKKHASVVDRVEDMTPAERVALRRLLN